MLKNRFYTGEITYRGEVRSGEDEPILGRDLFERSRRDRAPYSIWCGQRMLVAAGGNTTDFQFIEAEIPEPASRFVVTELAYDRTFAGEIVRNLQDEGLSLVEFGQGFLNMGPASAEFLRLLIGRELRHGGNPIATWCASNVSVRKDPAGNEKPDKERSTEKIDAIVAAVMAVGRMQAGGQGTRSVYESIASAAAAFRRESGNTTGAPRQADHPLGAAARQRRLGGSGSSVAGAPAKAERLADAA